MPDNDICFSPAPRRTPWNKGKLIGANPVIEEIRKRGAADPGSVVDAVTFGQDPGRMPLQAIVCSAIKR